MFKIAQLVITERMTGY